MWRIPPTGGFINGSRCARAGATGGGPISGVPHVHYFNRHLQYTIRPAATATSHDSSSPGLHHLCFQAASRQDVDDAYRTLVELQIEATPPTEYPEYHDDYYATFFSDPDGVRLEIVARSRYRDEIVDLWPQMRTFVNPVADLKGE